MVPIPRVRDTKKKKEYTKVNAVGLSFNEWCVLRSEEPVFIVNIIWYPSPMKKRREITDSHEIAKGRESVTS